MHRLVLAEGDRCDDGGRVQLQRDVLGRVVGRTACRPGCCPAGTRPRSSRSCRPASSAAPPAAAAEAARSRDTFSKKKFGNHLKRPKKQ